MGRPCRILVLNERDPKHPRSGGAEIHVAETLGRLGERGHPVTLVCTGYPGGPTREHVAGMEVVRLGRIRHYYPRVIAWCARETRRDRFDVVVECLNKLPFFSPVISAVPVVALCHHLFGATAFLQVPWPVAATVRLAERVMPPLYRKVPFVAISESSREDLIQRGVPPGHVEVVHCGIRRPGLPLPSLPERRHRVVYLGRLEPYKRIDILLRAMAQLTPRFPDAEILVIGRGSAQPSLEQLAVDLDLAGRTRFAGFVSDAVRDSLVAGSRVCVCPSVKEGWGLTVIEANALATPVVATDAPGLRDSVQQGKTGFLVPDGDVGAFATRIGELLSDDARWQSLSSAALAWSRRFDWDDAADRMEAIVSAAARGAR